MEGGTTGGSQDGASKAGGSHAAHFPPPPPQPGDYSFAGQSAAASVNQFSQMGDYSVYAPDSTNGAVHEDHINIECSVLVRSISCRGPIRLT